MMSLKINKYKKQQHKSAKFETLNLFLSSISQWHLKGTSSKRIGFENRCYRTGKYTVSQARPCIIQPGNVTGWDSEGVKKHVYFFGNHDDSFGRSSDLTIVQNQLTQHWTKPSKQVSNQPKVHNLLFTVVSTKGRMGMPAQDRILLRVPPMTLTFSFQQCPCGQCSVSVTSLWKLNILKKKMLEEKARLIIKAKRICYE